jgi:tetratricopeptide (TPR) repeat protein
MKSLSINIALLLLSPLALTAQNPKTAAQHFNKGLQLIAQGKPAEAEKAFTLAIEADSLLYDAWIKRGFVRGMNSDFEGEMNDYNRVIRYDEKHTQAYISRGAAYNRLKEYNKALNDFNKAIELDAASAESYNNRGFTRKMMGDMDGACKDWNKSKQLGNDEARIILKNNHCK